MSQPNKNMNSRGSSSRTTSSTAKRKETKSGKSSGRSGSGVSRTPGRQHMTVAQFPTLSQIKTAKSFHQLAIVMYIVRDAGVGVKCFDFVADAKFYKALATSDFKKARKIAQDRFSAVLAAGGKSVPFERQLAVRAAYSAELHKFLLTKKMPKATRSLLMKQLSYFIKSPKITKTPFDTDAVAETPFDEGKKSAKMKKSKRR